MTKIEKVASGSFALLALACVSLSLWDRNVSDLWADSSTEPRLIVCGTPGPCAKLFLENQKKERDLNSPTELLDLALQPRSFAYAEPRGQQVRQQAASENRSLASASGD